MKTFTSITTFFTLLLLLAGQSLAIIDWEGKCANKNPAVVNAAAKFCTEGEGGFDGMGGHLHIPSNFALGGVTSDHGYKHRVKITAAGHCHPPKHVTHFRCQQRLFKMCVHGGPKGHHQQAFGCQSWFISPA